jgi:ABC-type Zn uptake system ZnuABC Zn-binding protein ZnuA
MALLALLVCTGFAGESAPTKKTQILCTTFPIFQIARNVTQGRDGIALSLMLPAGLGCPHDYALTPQDMRRMSSAQILVANGLGLEEFLADAAVKGNTNLVVVDTSRGITGLLDYTEDDDHDEPAGHAHEHEGHNPHLFASPRMVAKIAVNIAAALAKADPAGRALYEKNAADYAARMTKLADEFVAAGKSLRNNRIVTQHGVFDYLAQDMKLDIVAVIAEHSNQSPSAAQMLAVVKTIREKNAGALFTEPQYPARTAKTLAKETGVPVAALDPVASGPDNAALDYYETTMRANLETLKTVLGTK